MSTPNPNQPKRKSKAVDAILEMRYVSNLIGTVYEAQVEQLQKLAKLTFEPASATVYISQEARFVKVDSTGSETEMTGKFPDMVKFILGDGWTTFLCYDVNNVSPQSSATDVPASKGRRSKHNAKPRRK